MYGLKKKKMIAVDFDGTCVAYDFPGVGQSIGAEEWLRKWVAAGAKLILWTMRSDELLEDAVSWFKENDIPLWGIQTNPGQKSWTSSPKAYAKLYVDDHGFGIPLIYPEGDRPWVDWSIVGPEVLKEL